MNAIRWGILGSGTIAHLFVQGLRHVADAQVVGVASRNKDNALKFASQYNIPVSYSSYEELAAASDIDVIYIATPATVHKDHALLCLKNKKHILVEKPFTINAAEAQEIIDEAGRQNRFCMEAMWMRFIPAMRKAKEIVDSGVLGDIRLLTADFGLAHPYDPNDRLYQLSQGGGSLLDLGVYPISLSWYLMGAASSATGEACMTPSGVDEQASVILNYDGGAKAVCCANLNALTQHEAVINGTHGRLRIHSPIWRPYRLSVETFGPPAKPGPAGPPGKLAAIKSHPLVGMAKQVFDGVVSPTLKNLKPDAMVPYVGNGYHYEAIEVNECIKAGKLESSVMPLKESYQIMNIMDSIRKQWDMKYPND